MSSVGSNNTGAGDSQVSDPSEISSHIVQLVMGEQSGDAMCVRETIAKFR
jgi:hypothetical protein